MWQFSDLVSGWVIMGDFLEYPGMSAEVNPTSRQYLCQSKLFFRCVGQWAQGIWRLQMRRLYLSTPSLAERTPWRFEEKNTKIGNKILPQGADIELVNWQRLAGVWGIRMFTKDGALHRFHPIYQFDLKMCDQHCRCGRFAGFKEPERERIAKHFTNNFNLDMLDRELSVKGCNQNSFSILSFD